MSRPRLHLPPARWEPVVGLTPAERHHLVDVLRLGPDAAVEVFDGRGRRSLAALVFRGGEPVLALGQAESVTEAWPRLCLAVALLKGQKLDLVVRMAVEIGVSAIQPFVSERSVREIGRGKLERLQNIAIQAARQAQRALVPEVLPLGTLDEVQSAAPGCFLLHERGAEGLSLLLTEARPRCVAVGPEGGFSDAEVERAERAGARVIGLPLPVLQAQTAMVVAAALGCLRTP